MFDWLRSCFKSQNPINLCENFCEGKTNEELIKVLKSYKVRLSLYSGNMIVCELLERLIKNQKGESDEN